MNWLLLDWIQLIQRSYWEMSKIVYRRCCLFSYFWQNMDGENYCMVSGETFDRVRDIDDLTGAKPTVGSSRMMAGESWRMAWAMPTRCRKPLESLRMRILGLSSRLQCAIALLTLRLRSPATIPLIRATKWRNPSTVICG